MTKYSHLQRQKQGRRFICWERLTGHSCPSVGWSVRKGLATRGDRRLLALGLASLVPGWVHPSLARLSWGRGGTQGKKCRRGVSREFIENGAEDAGCKLEVREDTGSVSQNFPAASAAIMASYKHHSQRLSPISLALPVGSLFAVSQCKSIRRGLPTTACELSLASHLRGLPAVRLKSLFSTEHSCGPNKTSAGSMCADAHASAWKSPSLSLQGLPRALAS